MSMTWYFVSNFCAQDDLAARRQAFVAALRDFIDRYEKEEENDIPTTLEPTVKKQDGRMRVGLLVYGMADTP